MCGARKVHGSSIARGSLSMCIESAGIDLPRRAISQSRAGDPAGRQLRRGDLVFFSTNARGSEVTHVGIYEGDGMMIDASKRYGKVRRDSLDDEYWIDRLMFARRVADADDTVEIAGRPPQSPSSRSDRRKSAVRVWNRSRMFSFVVLAGERESFPGGADVTRRARVRGGSHCFAVPLQASLIAMTSRSPIAALSNAPNAPAVRAASATSLSNMPLMTMTRARGLFLVISRQTSSPLTFGRLTSTRTTTGCSVSAASATLLPSLTVPTTSNSNESKRLSAFTMPV